jgi:ubiquitin C-terminal hydrolase
MSKESRGTTGLKNLGNSCYMNAILQCVIHSSPIVSYLLNGSASSDKATILENVKRKEQVHNIV